MTYREDMVRLNLLCRICAQKRMKQVRCFSQVLGKSKKGGMKKILDISFVKTEPNRPQNSKTENSVSAVRFSKNQLRRFGDGFSRCLIHNSTCSMIGSTVKVFFFMTYLCTSCSESLRLTISWTNSSRKYVISSIIHIKQHTVQKLNQKPKPQLI